MLVIMLWLVVMRQSQMSSLRFIFFRHYVSVKLSESTLSLDLSLIRSPERWRSCLYNPVIGFFFLNIMEKVVKTIMVITLAFLLSVRALWVWRITVPHKTGGLLSTNHNISKVQINFFFDYLERMSNYCRSKDLYFKLLKQSLLFTFLRLVQSWYHSAD